MKLILYSLSLLFLYQGATAQSIFNLRDRYDFPACTLTAILATDSCYYATGIVADTVPPYNTGALFMKLSLTGEPLVIKALTNPAKSYETWYNGLTRLPDGGFVVSGYTVDSTMKSMLIKYDADGDTIFTREYHNPFYPSSSFISSRGGMAVLPDGGFVLLNWITRNFSTASGFYLLRTDSAGAVVWAYEKGASSMDVPESLCITPEGSIIVGGVHTNRNTNVQDYVYRSQIFQVSPDGEEEWSWRSPEEAGLRDAANDMLLLNDGSLIVASGVGYEQPRASVNEVYFERHIFKLDPQRQLEWELTLPNSVLNGLVGTTKLVELPDGSGYILAGIAYDALPLPLRYNYSGWLAKISPQGDSLWTRAYTFLPSKAEHHIYDMKPTPDGGLIICGQVLDTSPEATYPQHGWLLKLDEHGCLVPGCHLPTGTDEAAPPGLRLAIYPNPASDYLNFHISPPPPAKRPSFRIVGLGGQVVEEISVGSPEATHVLPLWGLPRGAYLLQYLDEGQVLLTEKFVKQ